MDQMQGFLIWQVLDALCAEKNRSTIIITSMDQINLIGAIILTDAVMGGGARLQITTAVEVAVANETATPKTAQHMKWAKFQPPQELLSAV